MYNKKILLDALKKLDKAKAPAKKKDTMFDPTGKGMLNPNYAGKPVVLPTDTLYNPTPYTIKATSDNGIQKFLNPFDETPVHFPGASSIKEEPIMRKGGTKKFSKSLAATNKLMKKNPLLKKKSYKGKTYDPSAMYFQDGGTFEELELTDEEIEEYKKGGYVVEYVDDPSIPELTKAQNGLFLAANAAITSTPATKNTILAAGKGPVPITPVNPPTAKPVSFVPGVEYRYADRPDSSYKIGPNGQILIKNPDTGGQYVPIDDPGGSRRQTLLKGFQTGKTVPIAPPKASKELINKTRVVEPIPTPAPVPQTPPVIETWEPPAEPVMAPVIETAVSTPVSKSSEPKVRYHVEYNPYTRKYEPMSFRQRAELMSLYNRGLPMPENWQPELLDERTRQPIKKQEGGQLSKEEFAKRKAAYEKVTGRKLEQPKTIKQSEKARQATLDKYNQLPVVQSQPSETVDQSRGIDTRREKEIVEAQANTDAKAAENYMHFYNKTYGSDYGAITYEQALQKVRLPNFDKAKYLNMYNLGESKNEQLQSFRKEDQANRTWEVITNPFTAFEYAVTTGDMANMPSNINAARMQGYDVGATPGRNMVGNALNMTTNLFDAGDKVVRNVGEGNILGAGLEALRFLPGARMTTGLGKAAYNYGDDLIQTSKIAGKPKLPTYRNVYRVEHGDYNIPSLDNSVTGRWYVNNPLEANFYVKNLKHPETGQVLKEVDGKVKVMQQKIPDYKMQKYFGWNMGDEARMMSLGSGEIRDIDLDNALEKALGKGASQRFRSGFLTSEDIEQMGKTDYLYNPHEGILPAKTVNKNRFDDASFFNPLKKTEFANKQNASEYLTNEWDKMLSQNFSKYVPFFQQGGQLSPEEFEKRKAAYKKMTGRDFEPPKSFKQSPQAREYYQNKYNNQPVIQQQSSETVQQSRGTTDQDLTTTRQRVEQGKEAEAEYIARENQRRIQESRQSFVADNRSDAQRQRDQEAASELSDPTGWNQVANYLQAPLFQAGNFWDYISGGDDWEKAREQYNLNQLNPYKSKQDKLQNFVATGLSNTGDALMTGMEIADGYAIARAIPGFGKNLKNFFSTKTPQQLPGSPNTATVIDDFQFPAIQTNPYSVSNYDNVLAQNDIYRQITGTPKPGTPEAVLKNLSQEVNSIDDAERVIQSWANSRNLSIDRLPSQRANELFREAAERTFNDPVPDWMGTNDILVFLNNQERIKLLRNFTEELPRSLTPDDFITISANNSNIRSTPPILRNLSSVDLNISTNLSKKKSSLVKLQSTLQNLDVKLGAAIDRRLSSTDKPLSVEEVLDEVNDLLEKGVGVKKGDFKIKLRSTGSGRVDVDLNIKDYLLKNKKSLEKELPHLDIDKWLNDMPDDYVHSGNILLPTTMFKDSSRKLSEIVLGKSRPSQHYLKSGVPIEKPGLKRVGEFPFGNFTDEIKDNVLNNLGISGEYSKAINDVLKSKGQALYSGGTGHYSDGAKRYVRDFLKGRVDIVNPKAAEKLLELLNDPHWRPIIDKALKNKDLFLPQAVESAIQSVNFKYKKRGGQIQEKAIELELTPEEIEWYKSQGYVVEDLPNAQVGGTPSEIWKQYTNTSWSEAKKQGLTDGSAKQNIELANRLLAGEFGEAKVSYEDYQNSRATYDKMVVDKVMKGATLDDLVSQKVGTRSGLINRFPDLFGTQTSTQSKTLPDKASAKKETDNKRSSAPAQEPVITPPVVKQPEQQEPLSLQELREKIKGLKKNTNVTSPTRLLQEYLSNPIKYRKELEEFQKANQPSLHPSLYMKESDFNSSPVAPVPLSRGNTPQPIPGGLGSQITNIGRPGFVNQDLLRFTEEERQRHEEEAKGRVKQYDAGVLGNLLNPAGKAFTSLDTHKGLDNLKKDFNDYTQYAKRFAVKEGLADVEEEKVVIKKQKPVKPLPAKNKIDSYYNEIATVADKYTKSDSLLSYRNQWDNSKGFEYIATPVKKDRDPNGVYKNVKGVAHFLLDASANPIKPYSHEFNKSFLQKAKDNNDWIPTFQTVDASSDRVRLVYKKPDELTDADNVYAPLRQMKFSEINFSNTKTPKGFKTGIKEVTKNDGEGTYLIFKNRDGYSRFSGGSVVFIFKDKSGNTIVRDFAGSLNQIEKEGLDIQKQYNIKSEDLTIGYHDVGSFSAKPKANSKGELKTSQWNGFNPEAWTGGALLIPND